METYPHKVAGIYADRSSAIAAYDFLRKHGVPEEQLHLISPEDASKAQPGQAADDAAVTAKPGEDLHQKLEPEGDEVGKRVLKDHILGAGVGGVVGGVAGAAGVAAMAAGGVTLFAAAPVIATLAMAGWGAMVGATVGTGVGMEAGEFETMITDAAKNGQYILVVHASDEAELENSKQLIQRTVGPDEVVEVKE
ncbi:MAG: hypothetical protein ACOY5C_01135 [Pseudomonadota bacterium]|uniref:hypothetical protein n=1 Tax=Thermithiobacillus tepidarius TaxID=929 RepID=UPI00041F1B8E|nr:hypothetical protein [Thermithiobacillus tepidarius]